MTSQLNILKLILCVYFKDYICICTINLKQNYISCDKLPGTLEIPNLLIVYKLVETISTLITSNNYTHDDDVDTYKDSTHIIYNHSSIITICTQIFHNLLFCGYDTAHLPDSI